VDCQLIDVRRVDSPARLLLVVSLDDAIKPEHVSARFAAAKDTSVCVLQPRGVGASKWTQKNPPNYVERSFVLLGRTVDEGRILDIIAAARRLRMQHSDGISIQVAGAGAAAVLCAYAALIEPEITEVLAIEPLPTHADSRAPQLLSVLRVCDVPDVFGMLAPKALTIRMAENSLDATVAEQRRNLLARVRQIYEAAHASDRLHVVGENQ
jgi:hypothetical protein